MRQPIAKVSVRVKRAVVFSFVPFLLIGGSQGSMVAVKVVEDGTQSPMPNAEVINMVTGQQRVTDEHGVAPVPWPSSGDLRLRVRQVGYRFVDRTLKHAADGSADTITVALSRVVFTLPQVLATSQCSADADPESRSLSVAVLEQLREGAERYEAFRKAFPFRVLVENRTASMNADGTAKRIIKREGGEESDRWGERYKPGEVVDQTALGISIPILTISNLADSTFWDHHCFAAKGVEIFRGSRVIRLDFSPSRGARGADWAGSALVDSATSVLERIDFHLAGLSRDEQPRRLEGYTVFRSPTPYVVVPDTTLAMWWKHDPEGDKWGNPDVVAQLRITELQYRKNKPPAAKAP